MFTKILFPQCNKYLAQVRQKSLFSAKFFFFKLTQLHFSLHRENKAKSFSIYKMTIAHNIWIIIIIISHETGGRTYFTNNFISFTIPILFVYGSVAAAHSSLNVILRICAHMRGISFWNLIRLYESLYEPFALEMCRHNTCT